MYLCVVQLFEQRIVALAVTRTHARFENRLRELHAPTEPRRLALVLDLLQLAHGRNLKYLVKNGVLKFLGLVINPEEIKQSIMSVMVILGLKC